MSTKLWKPYLQDEYDKEYYKKLREYVNSDYDKHTIYPPKNKIFMALELVDPKNVSIVILGQDPYHGENQANGLAFSVNMGVTPPPSLRNIINEVKTDIGSTILTSGELSDWARQGVLLLNSTLTVKAASPNSHQHYGWQMFTDKIIHIVNSQQKPVVFMLWGAYAQRKCCIINNPSHLILTTSHPSPLSAHRGFIGCRHFSKANEFLVKNNREPIKW